MSGSLRPFDDSGPPSPDAYSAGCRGKQRFTSKKHAVGWRRILIAKRGANPQTLDAYRCKVCHGWHLGNSTHRKGVAHGEHTRRPVGPDRQ